MNLRFASALLALALPLSATAGEDAPGAKAALYPPTSDDFVTPSSASSKGSKDIIPLPPATTRWVLGAGLSLRNTGAIDFNTGVTNLSIPQRYAPVNNPVPGIGLASGAASRTYNDGFVRPDARVGRTTDYEYQNLAQLGPNTLTYHATGGERHDVTRTTSAAANSWSDDRDWEVAPYLKLSHLSQMPNGWSVGPSLHLSFANINGSRRGLNTILGREQREIFGVSATDTYDATGLNLPRIVPYTGAPNIAAPLLPTAPHNRVLTDTLRSTDVAVWNDSVSESLDVDTWSISLGAEAVYDRNDRFYASVGAGLALNVASWDAARSDQVFQQINGAAPVPVSSNRSSNLGSSVLWGLYLQSAAGVRVTENLSIEANLRYDLTEDLSGRVGNSSFDVELSGFSIGLGANYTFW